MLKFGVVDAAKLGLFLVEVLRYKTKKLKLNRIPLLQPLIKVYLHFDCTRLR